MKALTRKQLGLAKPQKQITQPVVKTSEPVQAPTKSSLTWEEVQASEEFKAGLFNVAVEAKKKVYADAGVGAENWTKAAEYPEVEANARNAAQEARIKYESERKLAFLTPY